MAKLRVESGEHGLNTKIFLNDMDISASVRGLSFKWGVGDVNTAEMTINIDEADIDTGALLNLKAYIDGQLEEPPNARHYHHRAIYEAQCECSPGGWERHPLGENTPDAYGDPQCVDCQRPYKRIDRPQLEEGIEHWRCDTCSVPMVADTDCIAHGCQGKAVRV